MPKFNICEVCTNAHLPNTPPLPVLYFVVFEKQEYLIIKALIHWRFNR